MAYTDQKMSGGKITAIIIVALIHLVIGYVFVTGLALNYVKKAQEKLNTFDVAPPPPPPPDVPPPPPPPDQKFTPPPVVTPPPIVNVPVQSPVVIQSVPTPPKAIQYTPIAAPPAPAPAPGPPVVSKAAGPRGDPKSWITPDDFPDEAKRAGEKGGTTGIAWTINAQGRVEGCHTTKSSGSAALDNAACRALTRRARYVPATDAAGNAIATTDHRNVVWQLQE